MKVKRQKTYHTHARKGKRVKVLTVEGESFVDKLVEYPTGKYHVFEKRGKVLSALIVKVEMYSKAYEFKTALTRVNRKLKG